MVQGHLLWDTALLAGLEPSKPVFGGVQVLVSIIFRGGQSVIDVVCWVGRVRWCSRLYSQ